jgi:hypothetical protein
MYIPMVWVNKFSPSICEWKSLGTTWYLGQPWLDRDDCSSLILNIQPMGNNGYLVGGLEHEFYDFPYVGNVIIPTDFHIFQRGRYTTNQIFKLK